MRLNITIRREPVDLATIVRDVAEANQPLAAKKQQRIEVSAPSGKLIACDGDRIREAIDNLLSNAIKYSPIGGRIELSLDLRPDSAQIRVKDEGPGMSEKDISRLYGRFQRLSAKPTGGESSMASAFPSSSASLICTAERSAPKVPDWAMAPAFHADASGERGRR